MQHENEIQNTDPEIPNPATEPDAPETASEEKTYTTSDLVRMFGPVFEKVATGIDFMARAAETSINNNNVLQRADLSPTLIKGILESDLMGVLLHRKPTTQVVKAVHPMFVTGHEAVSNAALIPEGELPTEWFNPNLLQNSFISVDLHRCLVRGIKEVPKETELTGVFKLEVEYPYCRGLNVTGSVFVSILDLAGVIKSLGASAVDYETHMMISTASSELQDSGTYMVVDNHEDGRNLYSFLVDKVANKLVSMAVVLVDQTTIDNHNAAMVECPEAIVETEEQFIDQIVIPLAEKTGTVIQVH